jgi:hypothetical protein
MKPTAILVDLGLLAACCLCACWSVAPAAAEGETPAGQEESEPAPAWVDELTEIRRKLGGALEGSSLDPATNPSEQGDLEFLNELQRLSAQQAPPIIPPPVPGESYQIPSLPGDMTGDDALIASLRNSARLLDEKANRLEVEKRYDRADRHRKLAGRLRLEARGLGPESE